MPDAPDIIRRPPPVLPANLKKTKPGDLICDRCGEINTSNRKFCARCGQPIEGGGLEPTKKKGGAKTFGGLTAGALLLRRVAPLVVIGLTLLYVAAPGARGWMNDRKEALIDIVDPPKTLSVSPPQTQGSTEAEGHSSTSAVDLNPLTYWQSQPQDQQPSLTMAFGVPVHLSEVIVRNGALNADNDYRFFRRARQVVAIMEFVDGTQKQRELTFGDSRIATIGGVSVIDGQHVKLDTGKPVTRLQLVVVSSYDAPPDSPLAITEIEFFTEKG
ncbi:MAG TPA: hypothetical protein VM282_23710 [Acidimicrobiales bacterium]|nr:hypothetical protein [Acidimicrobiales bacterium]